MAKAVTYHILNALNVFIVNLIESESFAESKIQRKIMKLIGIARGCTYYDNVMDIAFAFLRTKVAESIMDLEEVALELNDTACLSMIAEFKDVLINSEKLIDLTGKKSGYDVYNESLDLIKKFMASRNSL